MIPPTAATLIGSVGVALLLLAFVLNLLRVLPAESCAYLGLNAIGAGLAGYASYLIRFWPFVVLEGTWMAVAVAGLIRKVAGLGLRKPGQDAPASAASLRCLSSSASAPAVAVGSDRPDSEVSGLSVLGAVRRSFVSSHLHLISSHLVHEHEEDRE